MSNVTLATNGAVERVPAAADVKFELSGDVGEDEPDGRPGDRDGSFDDCDVFPESAAGGIGLATRSVVEPAEADVVLDRP